jgi:hypothetical protein
MTFKTERRIRAAAAYFCAPFIWIGFCVLLYKTIDGLISENNITFIVIIFIMMLAGLVFFVKAKLSVIKSVKLFSFGLNHMTPINKIFYKLGYLFMIFGSLVSVLILLKGRLWS